MTDHPNAALIREGADALERGDIQVLVDRVADDVEWHEIGRAEPIRGKATLQEMYMGGSAPEWDITYKIHDVVANDDHTIALGDAHATRGDRTLDYRTAEIYHIKDGKITHRWAFSDDTQRIIDFFA
jgi:ketosteroid isomerase-like protein